VIDMRRRTFVSRTAFILTGLSLSSGIVLADSLDKLIESDAWRLDMLRRLNAIRESKGLRLLQMDDRLNRAAQLHSDDMAARDFFDHKTPDGARMTDRADAFGYNWRRLLENIAAGQHDVQQAITGWMNSPDHRAAILDDAVKDAGMGYTFRDRDGGTVTMSHYWTLLVGAE
jgi:uncharacterized protein YkwD